MGELGPLYPRTAGAASAAKADMEVSSSETPVKHLSCQIPAHLDQAGRLPTPRSRGGVHRFPDRISAFTASGRKILARLHEVLRLRIHHP